jgi:cysteine desulfurase
VSPVTADPSKNFQEFSHLPTESLKLLPQIFALGDDDPRNPIGPGAENALRLNRAREAIASVWGLPRDSITFVADRYLAFYLAIMGSVQGGRFTEVLYSPIDKKEVLAIASGLDSAIERTSATIDIAGSIHFPLKPTALHIFQLRNGETGISQSVMPEGPLLIDATSLQPSRSSLPLAISKEWRALIMDATSWGGPRGVYPVAINPAHPWRNPLPTLDTSMPTYGANYALTLLAATTLESALSIDERAIDDANSEFRGIISTLDDVDIAGTTTGDRLSCSFLYIESEELQRRLFNDGFLVDSGSACSSSALEPSHVLTAMGLLSQGNVRLRFRSENLSQANQLANALVRHVTAMRREI